MSRSALGVGTKRGARSFYITVQPVEDEFGVMLVEVDTKSSAGAMVSRANPARARELVSALQRALKDSGHARATLTARRVSPVTLAEDAGVRLALTMFATEGVKKGRRKLTMMTAIDGMATEEAYYWYAKCVGVSGPRVRRALRLFLADE